MWEGGQGRGQREQGSRPRATCHGVAGPSANGGAFKESPSPSGGRGPREAPLLGSPRGQTSGGTKRKLSTALALLGKPDLLLLASS